MSLLRELRTLNDNLPPEDRILQGKKVKNDLDNRRLSKWVFFSKTANSGRIVEPRIGHDRTLVSAVLPDLTLHCLRRSFGTLAECVEYPVGISAQIIGHKAIRASRKALSQAPSRPVADVAYQDQDMDSGAGIYHPTNRQAEINGCEIRLIPIW